MDPKELLVAAAALLDEGDRSGARELLDAYDTWRARGGRQPSGGDAKAKRLRVKLNPKAGRSLARVKAMVLQRVVERLTDPTEGSVYAATGTVTAVDDLGYVADVRPHKVVASMDYSDDPIVSIRDVPKADRAEVTKWLRGKKTRAIMRVGYKSHDRVRVGSAIHTTGDEFYGAGVEAADVVKSMPVEVRVEGAKVDSDGEMHIRASLKSV